MKKIIIVLILALGVLGVNAQNTWEACGAASSYSLNGGACNVSSFNLNNATDSVYIGPGFTRGIGSFGSNIGNGVVYVEGTLSFPNNGTLQINSTGKLVIADGGQIVNSNDKSTINNDGTLILMEGGSIDFGTNPNAEFVIKNGGNATIDGTVTGNKLTVDGSSTTVIGSGTINTSSITMNNGATINGQPGPFTTPLETSDIGFTWNGTAWGSTGAPVAIDDRAVINGDYSTSINGALNTGVITVKSGNTLTFDQDEDLSFLSSLVVNGVLELVDNVKVGENNVDPSSTGQLKLTRNITRSGWHHVGFPALSGTIGDVVCSGFNLSFSGPSANVYIWDAANASWGLASSSTALAGQAFNVYTPNANASASLSLDFDQLNFAPLNVSYNYKDPGASAPGAGSGWSQNNKDGWNHIVNPYQTYLDWNQALNNIPSSFEAAIYSWDGTQYQVYSIGGSNDSRWVAPNQAVFIRNTTNSSGNFSLPLLMQSFAPSVGTSYFKTSLNNVLQLKGEGFTVTTEIVENPLATGGFDKNYDGRYLAPINNAPIFNTVGLDSTAYALNQLPVLDGQELYASFYHNSNNKTFTIGLDPSMPGNVNHIVLTDLYTGAVKDLTEGEYLFTSNKNAPAQRFKLQFSNSSIGIAEVEVGENLKVWFTAETLKFEELDLLKDAEVNVFTLNGQMLAQGKIGQDEINVKQSGVLLVNIIAKNRRSFNVKVVK